MSLASPAQALQRGDVLARGLSGGRRERCRAMLGDGRGFATDFSAVYLPWPLPDEVGAEGLAAAIALQCAPTKELLGALPLAHLNERERAALQLAEGAEALGWALRHWPGLAGTLSRLAAGVAAHSTPGIDATGLLARAVEQARTRAALQVPAVFGQWPLVPSARLSLRARRAQWESRLPWSARQRLQRLSTWSAAVGGNDGDQAAPRAGESDVDADDQALDQRGARRGTPYPEWDARQQRYRDNFVTVVETTTSSQKTRHSQPSPDPRLTAWFEQPLQRRWQHRLDDGADLDVDALVDWRIDELCGRHLGGGSRPDLYRDRRPAARDVACALLIDRSGSLAQAAHLQHQVACANALAAAMERAGERHAAFAFWSDTRHHVAVEVLRDFDATRPLRLEASQLSPRGYTRLGAAVRHASARLQREPSARRLLLVLSDAVPCDEGYEGAYAAADVAKAVEEAAQAQVTVAFIAVGHPADDPLAALLPGQLTRVSSLDGLAPVLAGVHARLAG